MDLCLLLTQALPHMHIRKAGRMTESLPTYTEQYWVWPQVLHISEDHYDIQLQLFLHWWKNMSNNIGYASLLDRHIRIIWRVRMSWDKKCADGAYRTHQHFTNMYASRRHEGITRDDPSNDVHRVGRELYRWIWEMFHPQIIFRSRLPWLSLSIFHICD